MKRSRILPAFLTLLALAACTGESQLPTASGKGSVRAINAIRTSPSVSFYIEQRQIGTVEFKNATTPADYDDLEYTFRFTTSLPGNSSTTQIASEALDVQADVSYTFVLTGSLASPTVTLWERPVPGFGETPTTFEVQFAHLAAGVSEADVYFAPPTTTPTAGQELGTIAFGEILPVASLDPGDYVLTLTAPGDPSTVLYQSDTLSPEAGTALIVTAFDADANDTAPVAMRVLNLATGGSSNLPDVNYPATFQFYHASIAAGPVDIYVDDPLTQPLVSGQTFGNITAPLEIAGDTFPLTYTSEGNVGSILVDEDRSVSPGTRRHIFLIENDDGENTLVDYRPNLRSVEAYSRLMLVNTAAIGTNIDVYLRARGEPLDEDSTPLIASYGNDVAPLSFTLTSESDYDLYVTAEGDLTPLAGPIALDTAFGDVVEVVVFENVDPAKVDVVITRYP